nr:MAG TPA: hypothetical protein [Caudoviricetes sp.]
MQNNKFAGFRCAGTSQAAFLGIKCIQRRCTARNRVQRGLRCGDGLCSGVGGRHGRHSNLRGSYCRHSNLRSCYRRHSNLRGSYCRHSNLMRRKHSSFGVLVCIINMPKSERGITT